MLSPNPSSQPFLFNVKNVCCIKSLNKANIRVVNPRCVINAVAG